VTAQDKEALTADFSSFYILLIVAAESNECHELYHVLNYFGFPFNVEEDNVLRPKIKREMGFGEGDEYPLMIVDSSSEHIDSADLVQSPQILKFLRGQELIGDH